MKGKRAVSSAEFNLHLTIATEFQFPAKYKHEDSTISPKSEVNTNSAVHTGETIKQSYPTFLPKYGQGEREVMIKPERNLLTDLLCSEVPPSFFAMLLSKARPLSLLDKSNSVALIATKKNLTQTSHSPEF